MGTYLKLTGTATLLIGLQLFNPGGVYAASQISNISSKSFLAIPKAASLSKTLLASPLNQANEDDPKCTSNCGAPGGTRGGGRRA